MCACVHGRQGTVLSTELGNLEGERGKNWGGTHHGEEQHDPGVDLDRLPQAKDLALPCRMLHENHVRAVFALHLFRVDEA